MYDLLKRSWVSKFLTAMIIQGLVFWGPGVNSALAQIFDSPEFTAEIQQGIESFALENPELANIARDMFEGVQNNPRNAAQLERDAAVIHKVTETTREALTISETNADKMIDQLSAQGVPENVIAETRTHMERTLRAARVALEQGATAVDPEVEAHFGELRETMEKIVPHLDGELVDALGTGSNDLDEYRAVEFLSRVADPNRSADLGDLAIETHFYQAVHDLVDQGQRPSKLTAMEMSRMGINPNEILERCAGMPRPGHLMVTPPGIDAFVTTTGPPNEEQTRLGERAMNEWISENPDLPTFMIEDAKKKFEQWKTTGTGGAGQGKAVDLGAADVIKAQVNSGTLTQEQADKILAGMGISAQTTFGSRGVSGNIETINIYDPRNLESLGLSDETLAKMWDGGGQRLREGIRTLYEQRTGTMASRQWENITRGTPNISFGGVPSRDEMRSLGMSEEQIRVFEASYSPIETGGPGWAGPGSTPGGTPNANEMRAAGLTEEQINMAISYSPVFQTGMPTDQQMAEAGMTPEQIQMAHQMSSHPVFNPGDPGANMPVRTVDSGALGQIGLTDAQVQAIGDGTRDFAFISREEMAKLGLTQEQIFQVESAAGYTVDRSREYYMSGGGNGMSTTPVPSRESMRANGMTEEQIRAVEQGFSDRMGGMTREQMQAAGLTEEQINGVETYNPGPDWTPGGETWHVGETDWAASGGTWSGGETDWAASGGSRIPSRDEMRAQGMTEDQILAAERAFSVAPSHGGGTDWSAGGGTYSGGSGYTDWSAGGGTYSGGGTDWSAGGGTYASYSSGGNYSSSFSQEAADYAYEQQQVINEIIENQCATNPTLPECSTPAPNP
jgi:hypothetical protein